MKEQNAMKRSLMTGGILFGLVLMEIPFIESAAAAAADNSQRLEAAGKTITELIVLFTVIVATIGIFIGAIKIRNGVHSEGKDVIKGSCVCLFIVSSLYMIISFVSG